MDRGGDAGRSCLPWPHNWRAGAWGRAREAISKLLEVAPPEATLLHSGTEHGVDDHGQHEHRVPVDLVAVGSLVRVRPGERVPFDGEVVRGASFVNQALITGEAVAVEKSAGDDVYAGTMNENGVLDVRTTRPASDTTIARMIRMVEESQTRRAPSEQFVEKFTRYYTPAVFLLAFSVAVVPPLARGGGWAEWFYMGMVILLISCPCALVISTPVSIVRGVDSGGAARRADQGRRVSGGSRQGQSAGARQDRRGDARRSGGGRVRALERTRSGRGAAPPGATGAVERASAGACHPALCQGAGRARDAAGGLPGPAGTGRGGVRERRHVLGGQRADDAREGRDVERGRGEARRNGRQRAHGGGCAERASTEARNLGRWWP